MGGPGSGRKPGGDKRPLAEEVPRLDVRELQRGGFLRAGGHSRWNWSRGGALIASLEVSAEGHQVLLEWRHPTGGLGRLEEATAVELERLPAPGGGHQTYFRCPVPGCGRRVSILFCGEGISCRRCQRLAYASQGMSSLDRAVREAERVRHRLGWERDIHADPGQKPKGMHTRTYQRLKSKHDRLASRALAGLELRLMAFQECLERMLDELPDD